MIKLIEDLFIKNGFIFSFLLVGVMMLITDFLSKRVIKNKIPGVALAIVLGLILAAFGGEKGIANIPIFAGMAILGGSMMRDFAIVSTSLGASFEEIKKAGWVAFFSLLIGIFFLVYYWNNYILFIWLPRCKKYRYHCLRSMYLHRWSNHWKCSRRLIRDNNFEYCCRSSESTYRYHMHTFNR